MTSLLPITRDFLRSWLDWVEAGAPDGEPYPRAYGLCSAAGMYEALHGVNNVYDNLSNYFAENFDDQATYPFGGEKDYDRRMWGHEQHLNEQRLAFAREHASPKEPSDA